MTLQCIPTFFILVLIANITGKAVLRSPLVFIVVCIQIGAISLLNYCDKISSLENTFPPKTGHHQYQNNAKAICIYPFSLYCKTSEPMQMKKQTSKQTVATLKCVHYLLNLLSLCYECSIFHKHSKIGHDDDQCGEAISK